MDSSSDLPELEDEFANDLRARLCAWYASHRRDLPWRRTRDPYAVWISEAMLQQTRVETVVPYWERFLARFPTVVELARASEDELLAAWSGLGYYRRARSLRRAAIVIVERFGGRFPRAPADALALPGVGPYTAGAVLSIAYDEPRALVDGNVLRVFARLFALTAPLGSRELSQRVWTLAEKLVPGKPEAVAEVHGPGAWNQALMELGATLCVPREPRCRACPVRELCAANLRGITAELPRPGRKPASVGVEIEIMVVARAGRFLVERRAPSGRMAGMWECPTREVAPVGAPGARLFPTALARPVEGGVLEPRERLVRFTHSITHHRIRADVLVAEVVDAAGAAGERELRPGFAWSGLDEVDARALTGMTKKLLRDRRVRLHVEGRLGSAGVGPGMKSSPAVDMLARKRRAGPARARSDARDDSTIEPTRVETGRGNLG